jgi:receptor protein-tyrosine kinase
MFQNAERPALGELVSWSKPPARSATGMERDWLLPETRELYRSIYTRAGVGALRALAVTSAVPSEGKTTTALGIATAYAQDFPLDRVVVVECDVRRATLAADFGFIGTRGFVDYLTKPASGVDPCQSTLLDNLHLLPVGGPVDNASRLFRSTCLPEALAALAADHALVILDVPPILGSSDAQLLCAAAGAALLIARTGMTPTDQVRRAVDVLGDALRGVVLNGTSSAVPSLFRHLAGW